MSAFFVAMDRKMRQLLAGHLKPLVPADEVQPTVELLRILVNGVVLASAEHPTKWPRKRQLALLDRTLRLLDLAALGRHQHGRRERRGVRRPVLAGHDRGRGRPDAGGGPGDVALLPAGAATMWTVHETLRKVYLLHP